MANDNVIDIRSKKPINAKLLIVSDDFDGVFKKYLYDKTSRNQIDPKELFGIAAHRLGYFMGKIEGEANKKAAVEMCVKILKQMVEKGTTK